MDDQLGRVEIHAERGNDITITLNGQDITRYVHDCTVDLPVDGPFSVSLTIFPASLVVDGTFAIRAEGLD